MTKQTILILDFGSQYTQLIARRVRENKVFSKIIPYNTPAKEIAALAPKGLIFSGGPASVTDKKSPYPDKAIFKLGIPILGICYGMQVITEMLEEKSGIPVSGNSEKLNYLSIIPAPYSAIFPVILPAGPAMAIM